MPLTALRPMQHRQYRLLFSGLLLTMLADGMWIIAIAWEVIRREGTPTDMSVVSGASALGMVLSALVGGALSDRNSQRHIIISLEIVKSLILISAGIVAVHSAIPLWQFAFFSFVLGAVSGTYYPAYASLVPTLVPESELLAVNGLEGGARPTVQQAVGPALAGMIVGSSLPGYAMIVAGAASIFAGITVSFLHAAPVVSVAAQTSYLVDIRAGFSYMWQTPWLRWSLLFFSVLVMMVMGPLEVLIPFAIKEQAGGNASDHGWILLAYGLSGALASLAFASFAAPRRYLTVIIILWGISGVPLIVMGFVNSIAGFMIAGVFLGILFESPMVLWGTLLQQRVPTEMLGRISSLDFLLSVALFPLSIAIAAPIAEYFGLTATLCIAGLVPIPFAVGSYLAAKMWIDEVEHPLISK